MNRRLLFVVLAALLAAGTATAQQSTGSVKGVVKDDLGSPVPGATVSVTGPASRTGVTGADGSFLIGNLPPGTYTVAARLSGFTSKDQPNVEVAAGSSAEVSFTLSVAPLSETVVVTGSRSEEKLVDAPATMSVVGSDTLETTPAQNYGDLLRSVPGLNVTQTSARDINIVSREASSTLSNSQLTLVDGRSVYLDFFGLVLWDFVPTNPQDIKQIEVVRGPASVVWGANALTGVVNIITKSPREQPGGNLVLNGGGFSRDAGSTKGEGMGSTYGGSFGWAAAPNDTWSYKLSAGFFHSDAYPRPTGTIPVCGPGSPCLFNNPVAPDVTTGGAPYPSFENTNTDQPKVDLRVDQELANGGRISYTGGYAGTRGIIHSGIGPFDIRSGSYMGFGRVNYTKGGLKLSGFANFVDAKAPNLLQVDVTTGQQLQLNFKTQTYDLEVGNTSVVGGHHILTYGGNARRNNFDITIAPAGQDRNEFGAYFQDEVAYEKFRLAAGARVDKFGNLDKAVFSPRVALTFKPTPDQSLRISFNKAFRSPSLINNYLDTRTIVPVDLSVLTDNLAQILGAELLAAGLPPALVPATIGQYLPILLPSVQGAFGSSANPRAFLLGLHSLGSELRPGGSLKEESLKAYEIAYTGTFANKATLGLAFYINDRNDNVNFVAEADVVQQQTGIAPYTSTNPPAGWPVSPVPQLQPLLNGMLDVLAAQGILLPTTATYLNLGPTRNKGFEASLDVAFNKELTGSVNYSYQSLPRAKDVNGSSCDPAATDNGCFPLAEFGVPPKNRFNAALSWNSRRFLGTVNVNFTDKAFWTDVLSSQDFGPTDSFTLVNASFGVKWNDGKVVTMVKGTNLANTDVQEHIFGDIIKRSIVGEVRFTF
jgi:outer membrane receptor protein involved in Fe transport